MENISCELPNYNGYQGSIETSIKNRCLHGKILNITDLILYEGQTLDELEADFKKSVNDYLKTCKELGIEPKRPFKGSFNVRIGPELHEKAAKRAGEIDFLPLSFHICQQSTAFVSSSVKNLYF